MFRFDQGEEVLAELIHFCEKNQIHAGWLSGIGASAEVAIGFYNPDTKTYEDRTLTEPLEVVSLGGNVASMNGHLMVHAHGSFGNQNYEVVGGHVHRLVVGPAFELLFTRIAGKLKRTPDLDTRLNLLG